MARRLIKWDLHELIDQVQSVCTVDDRGCWVWEYMRFKSEWYPEIRMHGERVRVARMIMLMMNPDSSHLVRHSCDRPRCCNPEHLDPGTYTDNLKDMYERGRQSTVRAIGQAHGRTPFSDADIITIREKHSSGVSIAELARTHGACESSIRNIVKRRSWKHL